MAVSTNNTASVFRSDPFPLTPAPADGTVVVHQDAHGLGVVPDLVQVWAIAGAAGDGYAIGDRVLIAVNHGGSLAHRSNEDALWVVVDAVNVEAHFSGDGENGLANLRSQTDGTLVPLDLADWTFVIVAVAFIAPP